MLRMFLLYEPNWLSHYLLLMEQSLWGKQNPETLKKFLNKRDCHPCRACCGGEILSTMVPVPYLVSFLRHLYDTAPISKQGGSLLPFLDKQPKGQSKQNNCPPEGCSIRKSVSPVPRRRVGQVRSGDVRSWWRFSNGRPLSPPLTIGRPRDSSGYPAGARC